MRKKERIILENVLVEDYAAEGKCLSRIDGKVYFIENVVPGDVVDIQLRKNKKDWAEAFPVAFRSYSSERVKPFCSHFGICGGCQWQHLPYEKQLAFKQKQVKDNLERIGKVVLPPFLPIAGVDHTKYYRNKMEYTFGTKEYTAAPPPKKGKGPENAETIETPSFKGVGFHARGFFDKIVDIKTCYLQGEPSNAIRLAIKEFAIANDYSFYDIRNHVGFLRTMQVRLCTTGELMVNVVFGEKDMKKIKALFDFLLGQFSEITTLLYTINTKKNDSLYDLDPVAYFGEGFIWEQLGNYRFKIGPKSFFQTNTKQAEKLYEITKEFAELTGHEVVYDLYCGTGSIGIYVSDGAKKIIGVETIAEAIEDAKENAAVNQLKDAHFFAGDVINIVDEHFFATHGKPDVVITDPPRAGMHEKLVEKLLAIEAPTIVYVSCNPATQARDLQLLDAKYQVTKVQPVDMFPHTLHIENVVQLKLRKL